MKSASTTRTSTKPPPSETNDSLQRRRGFTASTHKQLAPRDASARSWRAPAHTQDTRRFTYTHHTRCFPQTQHTRRFNSLPASSGTHRAHSTLRTHTAHPTLQLAPGELRHIHSTPGASHTAHPALQLAPDELRHTRSILDDSHTRVSPTHTHTPITPAHYIPFRRITDTLTSTHTHINHSYPLHTHAQAPLRRTHTSITPTHYTPLRRIAGTPAMSLVKWCVWTWGSKHFRVLFGNAL